MSRSFWKYKFFSPSVWRQLFYMKKYGTQSFRYKYKDRLIHSRSSTIPISFKGFRWHIYKGALTRFFLVTKFNVGMKFGEFGFTRKPFYFPLRKKKGRCIRR